MYFSEADESFLGFLTLIMDIKDFLRVYRMYPFNAQAYRI